MRRLDRRLASVDGQAKGARWDAPLKIKAHPRPYGSQAGKVFRYHFSEAGSIVKNKMTVTN